MIFQLISLRLIRTPDKANKFWPSVGVRINEVILYMISIIVVSNFGLLGPVLARTNFFVTA